MTVTGIDEDWSKADPAGLAAAGYGFAVGYVSEDTTGKNLTRAQVDAIHAAGLAVGLVYEYATQAALGGAARGTRDAGIAISHARTLSTPAGVCLYAAVDWQVTAAQLPVVLEYALAFQAACRAAGYRAGIYGSYAVCQYLSGHGYTGFLWQTYAWSASQWWSGAVLRQTQNGIHVAGATVDRDVAEALDWGQWKAQMAAPHGAAEGDTMLTLVRKTNDPQVWLADGMHRRPIAAGQELADVRYLASIGVIGLWKAGTPNDGDVYVADDLDAFGVLAESASVDGDSLAQKVAALILPAVTGANATAVVDELAHRLAPPAP